LLAKPTPRNVNLGSVRFAMFNNQRDIFPAFFSSDYYYEHAGLNEPAATRNQREHAGNETIDSMKLIISEAIPHTLANRLLQRHLARSALVSI